MGFKSELNDFWKTRFIQSAILIWDYYVIISVIYLNCLLYYKKILFEGSFSLLLIIFLSILIYIIFPKIYLYLLKKLVYKSNFQIKENNFYIDNISFETFKKGRSIYCKEYDSIILLGVATPKLICKYKLRIFLINKSELKEIHLKILKEFYEPKYIEI